MVSGRYDPDGLHHQLEVMAFYYLAASIAALIIGISGWVYATRMRRRIKKDLGRAAGDADLASLETWMKVDEVEQKKTQAANGLLSRVLRIMKVQNATSRLIPVRPPIFLSGLCFESLHFYAVDLTGSPATTERYTSRTCSAERSHEYFWTSS